MNSTKISRREQFCQLKKEIRGSRTHLIVGIDVAKDKHHAFMGTATGRVLFRKLIFTNDLTGFNKLLFRSEAVMVQNGLLRIVYGMEPTGNYHKPLGRYLLGRDLDLVLVSGVAVKNNRELLDGRWDKHDTKCAANIADLISQGKCLFYDAPTDEIEQLRGLLSLRKKLKKEEHSLRMRIRNALVAKYFPEFDRYFGTCKSESLAIVKWCLDPKKIAAMQFVQFFNMVTVKNRGLKQRQRLGKIHQLAVESIGLPIGEAAEYEAELLVDKLKSVDEQIRETAIRIECLAESFGAYYYLKSIPGFGPYVSAVVLAVIGDPFRFKIGKEVLRLSGYDLNANRSGKKSALAVPVISKRGNSTLRYALYQAALVASVRNQYFIKLFTNMIRGREREKGIKTKMRVKLAAKMLVIAWTLMKKQEVFNPNYLNIT